MAKIPGVKYMTGYEGTAYDPALGGINTDGDPTTTSTGRFVYNQSLAVNPDIIPYGSIVHVHTPSKPEYDQIWLAADTGGHMKSQNGGKRVDMGMKNPYDYGRNPIEVAIIERGTGPADARAKAKIWDQILAKYGKYGQKYNGSGAGSSASGVPTAGGDLSLSAAMGKMFEYSNPTMVRGKSPNVEDDDYPEHRFAGNPFVLRIGDSQFFIPPINIKTSKVTMVDGQHSLRHKSMTVIKSGYTTQRVEIRLVFGDTDQINGFKVPAPGDKHYYMDGLRALLAQFYRNPFMPIRNELLNDRHGIFNVALENINIVTDPDIPNMVICDLSLIECTVEPFIQLPDFMYDYLFNYPLWRWYYQQMIFDDAKYRRTDMHLRPVSKHMSDETFFRVLSPTQIAVMEEEVVQQARRAANDTGNFNYYLNPQYILSKFPMTDIQKVMSDWDIGGAICTGVQIGISKELTPFHLEEYETPVFQDVGGVTRVFIMDFYCTTRDELESLQSLVKHAEMTAREYRHRFAGGFIAIDHELINLAGIQYAMPVNIETQTVEGVDDNYIVTISFQEFNVNQKDGERLNGVNSQLQEYAKKMNKKFEEVFALSGKMDRKPEIIYENFVEDSLAQLILYPDLDLPTIEDLNNSIKTINAFRKKRGQSEMPMNEHPVREGTNMFWAEPDFYFVYPNIEDAYESIGLGDYGMKMNNLIYNSNHNDPNSYEDIMNDTDGIQFGELLGSFTSRFTDNSFNPFEAQESIAKTASIDLDWTIAAKDHIAPAFADWDKDTHIPEVQDLIPMMLHDHVRYDYRYRMAQAFPTFMFLFVDEGQWVDGRRLWNNHYSYHSVHEISIVKDKDNPVDLAYIQLANTYGTFNYSSKMSDPRTYQGTIAKGWDRIVQLWESFNLTAEDVMANRYNLMESASLKEGARLHIRLGYSSNAANLPICFNGHIASVNEGPIIDIVAQGDGVELINQVVSTNPSEGTPNEPHNAFMRYLTARQSNYWFSASAQFELFNNYESRYGIEHFGWVESLADDGSGAGANWAGGVTESIINTGGSIVAALTPEAWFGKQADSKILKWANELGEFIGSQTAQFFDGLIIDNATWIASKITGIPNFNVYDVMKNIYRGSFQPETGVINYKNNSWRNEGFFEFWDNAFERWNVFDGEKNVNFSAYNKTLWDLGQQYSMFVPEFICAPHHHGLRSTLFFGMPHWPVKYGYVKTEDDTSGLDIKHYSELYKPYQQLHVYVTGSNIIKNNIKANSEHIKHVATGMYYRGDINTVREGLTVYADRSIIASEQKSMILDTGVYQDLFGPDAVIEFLMRYVVKQVGVAAVGTIDLVLEGAEWLTGWLGKTGIEVFEQLDKAVTGASDWVNTDKVEDWFNGVASPGRNAALSVTIGSLQRSFMDMYQGELITFGDPSAKPWDLFHLNDTNFNMSGTAQIGKITHTLSRRSGFTSVIKPDLIVGRTDGRGGRNVVIQAAVAGGSALGIAFTRRVISSRAFRWLMKRGTDKSWNGMERLAKVTAFMATGKRGAVRTAQNFFDFFRNIGDDETKMGKVFDAGKKAIKGNLFFVLLTGGISEKLMQWYDKETKYNNVIYIYPLWKSGEPFAAGIRGAAHIIPGYIDPRYADPLGIGLESGNVGMSSPMDSVQDVTSTSKVIHPLGQPGRLTSHYGWRPEYNRMHYGTDFGQFYDTKGNKTATKVYAIADGVIDYNGYGADGEGNWLRIRHKINGQDYVSAYKHFDRKPNLQVGAEIKAGTFIEYIGNSGDSTAPHLHFEIQKGSKYKYGSQMNPVDFFKQMGVPLE